MHQRRRGARPGVHRLLSRSLLTPRAPVAAAVRVCPSLCLMRGCEPPGWEADRLRGGQLVFVEILGFRQAGRQTPREVESSGGSHQGSYAITSWSDFAGPRSGKRCSVARGATGNTTAAAGSSVRRGFADSGLRRCVSYLVFNRIRGAACRQQLVCRGSVNDRQLRPLDAGHAVGFDRRADCADRPLPGRRARGHLAEQTAGTDVGSGHKVDLQQGGIQEVAQA